MLRKLCLPLIIPLFLPSLIFANTDSITATYTIGSINAIALSGNPSPLVISSATAGLAPNDAVDASTSYAITTNNTARKIYASLSTPMPSGVTLSLTVAAPTGAISSGKVDLSTTAAAVVTGISNVAQSGLTITYTLSASVAASPTSGLTNTVTYTIGP